MASIRERRDSGGKKTHQAQVRLNGYPAQTKTFASKTDAKRWAHQTEVDIRSGMFIRRTQATTHTVADLLDEYQKTAQLTRKTGRDTDKAALAFWRKHLGTYKLSVVTPKLVEAGRDILARESSTKTKALAPATVLRYMMRLSHAFSMAVNWQWCERNPVEAAVKPKVSNRRVRYLRDDERERLLAACRMSKNHDLYLVVVLAISTGMRKGEITGMAWDAVTFYDDRGYAKLLLAAQDTKNGTQRSVLIASQAYQIMNQRRKVLSNLQGQAKLAGLIFPSAANPASAVDFRSPWETALKKAAIADFKFHDLRHTAASYMAMNGATTLEIKEALGHKSTAMAERYAHLSQSHVDDVVLKMNERHFGKNVSRTACAAHLIVDMTKHPGDLAVGTSDVYS